MRETQSSFQSVRALNWAWQYWNARLNDWVQFECTDCLVLEFDYQAYQIQANDRFKTTDILHGTVNFDTFELTTYSEPIVKINVRRTQDNVRKRPNAYKRHDPFIAEVKNESILNFLSSTDLEWMSLNYRKERAAKLSTSKRRMILLMF